MSSPQAVHSGIHMVCSHVRSVWKTTRIKGRNERGRKVLRTPFRPLTLNFHRTWKEALPPMVEAAPSSPLAGDPERSSNPTLTQCRDLSAEHAESDPAYAELMAVYARMGELLDEISTGLTAAGTVSEWHDMLTRVIAIGQERERRYAEAHQVLLLRFKAGEA